MDEDTFSFLKKTPAELSHTIYCPACFDQHVAPALVEYQQSMEAAKEIAIFFDNQGKETRLIKRLEEPYKVENCQDRNETILRLAFWAAQNGFNCLVDVAITSSKTKSGSYTTQVWQGSGIPAHVDESKLIKDRSFSNYPN